MIARLAVYGAGLGVLLIGITALALYTTDYVERQLSMQASEVFNTWVFREVSYEVDGDNLTLSGQVKDQDVIDRAVRQAKIVVGEGHVNNLLSVQSPADDLPDATTMPDGTPIEEIHFIVQKRQNTIHLYGVIRSEKERDFIHQNLSSFTLVDQLEVKPLPKRWNDKLFHLTKMIKKFERLTLDVQDHSVHIHGTVKLGEQIDLITSYMKRLFPNAVINADLAFESLGQNTSKCQMNLDLLLNAQPQLFVDGSVDFLKSENKLFNAVAHTILDCHLETFEIISSASSNDDLNFQRAKAIKAILINKGITPEKLSVNKKSCVHLSGLASPQLIININ